MSKWIEIYFSDLKGKIFKEVRRDEDPDKIIFIVSDDEVYRLFHHQDCCESVDIEDICGDLKDLEGSEILEAEEAINEDEEDDRKCWTFYKISTIKGTVTIRWYGVSHYYSVKVDCEKLVKS